MTVLVVDDDPLIRAVASRVLRAIGCAVEAHPDAEAALAAIDARRDAVELVLSDVTMPGRLDGIDLARRLADSDPAIPVVLMSGDPGSLAGDGRLGNVRAVLAKPFQIEELAAAVERGSRHA